jgi:tetratricopeptide (TPR) repeat protein
MSAAYLDKLKPDQRRAVEHGIGQHRGRDHATDAAPALLVIEQRLCQIGDRRPPSSSRLVSAVLATVEMDKSKGESRDRDASRLSSATRLGGEYGEALIELPLQDMIDARQYGQAAAFILRALNLLAGERKDYAAHLILQLAYLLAVSSEARRVACPDDAVEIIENAVAYLAKTQPNAIERLANAYNNLGTVRMLCMQGDATINAERAMEAYEHAINIFASGGEAFLGRIGHSLLQRSKIFRWRASGDPAKNVDLAFNSAQAALEILSLPR